jgi:nucleotide-binding universal stress UspA family protein
MDVTSLAPRGQRSATLGDQPDLTCREVVVGYDATPAADAAVRWAAVEAERLGTVLTVVCAVEVGTGASVHAHAPEAARVGRELARRGAQIAHEAAPGAVAARVVGTVGGAAGELVARSASASLVVVGAPRARGVAALGSVSFGVTLHARCPVVLVPEHADPHFASRDVVVGVDGSRSSRSALDLAARLAVAGGGHVRVVTAWQPTGPGPSTLAARDLAALSEAREEAARHDLAAAVEQVGREHPELEVSGSVLQGPVADVLTDVAADAGLLVVGSRGHGGFAGLALGSVCHAVVRSAQVPVAVVRQGWW